MTTINTALRRIMTIPREVLHHAFAPKRYDPTRRTRYYDNKTPLSLEAIITDQLIRGRVLKDVNLISGTDIEIPLTSGKVEAIDMYTSVYKFDDAATSGRTITNVYELVYGHHYGRMGGYAGALNQTNQSGMLMKHTKEVIRAAGGPDLNTNHLIQIVGHNTVFVSGTVPRQDYGYLRCMVTNDPNMNNLPPPYQVPFSQLCMLAAKSYVYTALVIELDEGMIRGGQQIGRFREIVDSFADAEEMYMEKLDEWQKIGIMADPNQYRKVLRMSLGIRPKL